ncbi:MAG: tRNA (N(6)-L-threonylcarbamoyladenosine(37)-C(2))-methylthiotransferase MtaB [Prevotella sp.]|nr:tRNA (N(6)-L-threonylcarbamoyladenosine(37)-C(2))-methylthiotransferase MtaB [Prevotella sp.]
MIDTSTFQGKTAAYFTLGCKLNFSETSTFARLLGEMGVRTATKGERADIVLINTCSVTEVADRKCRQAIHRLVRQHPGAFVVVTGCYAQLDSEEVAAIPGVSMILGSNEKDRLVQFLSEELRIKDEGSSFIRVSKTKDIRTFAPSCSRGNRTRYFLKVQDGCDYFCTYCTIPYARGFSRNPTIASLVEQARQAADDGGREIVLTGVNIGDFGKTTGERFIDLVRALDGVVGISRFRISSLEPDLLSDELIQYVAHDSRAFMPHFHIPLQSGSDEVLRLMRRHYDSQLFAEKITRIKELMPQAFIGVDVMVGCRGETPECFEETRALLERLPVTQLHVFPYSERPGTSALKIPYVVSEAEKKRRSHVLLELSEQKTRAFYAAHTGHEAEVLLERATRGRAMHGFTRNYIRVELPPQDARPELDNQIVGVTLGDFNHDHTALIARLNTQTLTAESK